MWGFPWVHRGRMRFTATAYCVPGVTAKGDHTKAGTAAADPAVIPLGSTVQVYGAGIYSGVYAVTDTGPMVSGRLIDLYVPSAVAAKKFGRRRVHVKILTVGDNVKGKPQTTPVVPKADLAPAVKPAATPQQKTAPPISQQAAEKGLPQLATPTPPDPTDDEEKAATPVRQPGTVTQSH